jgi:cytochrome c-type biogenesis protein
MIADLSLAVALGAGVLSFLSPCVLPIFPSYLSFIAGVSFDEAAQLADRRTKRAVLLNALLFVGGFSLVFVTLGASFSLIGQALFDSQRIIRRAGGLLVILLGLHTLGWPRLPFLMREARLELKGRPAGYIGAFVIGVTFAAGWTPCVGPILGAILSLASTAQTALAGTLLLVAYSAGLALPFLASALALNRFLGFFDRFKRFLPVVSTVSGLFLILVGTLLVTDYFALLSTFAIRLTPEWLIRRL